MSSKEPYYDGNDKMNYLTLYDFLRTYNFRYYDSNAPSENLKHNSTTIRIYFGESCDDWFELGMYDYGSDVSMEGSIKTTINPQLLSRKVINFYVEDYLQILCVHLEKDE